MDVREKLVELIGQVQDCGCDVTDVVQMNYVENITLADHLIAHGVTVQEWISVKDRLPEKHETVLACATDLLTNDKDFYLARFDGEYWVASAGYLFGRVTHWTPLPQPPKGE